MNEIHLQARHDFTLVKDMKQAGVGEAPQYRGLYLHLGAEFKESFEFGRWHCQGHPLLSLGNHDLPGLQAGVL